MEADFASVWSRVTGLDPAEDELTMLRRWIRDETETMRSYEGLLRSRLPNMAAETLRSLLREQRGLLRRLQTLYYLRTGDALIVPQTETQKKQPLMKALRESYEAALTQAEGYRRATTVRRDTAELCIKLAEAKDAQADGLYRLTERLL